jgi:hypothetical protein
MELPQQNANELSSFKVVCDNCGSLSIKLTEPGKAALETTIKCGRCSAVRGTLADLKVLARRGKETLEF